MVSRNCLSHFQHSNPRFKLYILLIDRVLPVFTPVAALLHTSLEKGPYSSDIGRYRDGAAVVVYLISEHVEKHASSG